MKRQMKKRRMKRLRIAIPQLDQKGSALVLAIFLVIIGSLLMAAGSKLVVNSRNESRNVNNHIVEADNVARAGVVDALAWFKNQSNGVAYNSGVNKTPDEAFYPREIVIPTPSRTPEPDTLDEDIGMVKEFPVGANLDGGQKWMRYEIHRQRYPTKYPDGSPFPTATPPTPFATPTRTNTPGGSPTATPMPWDKYAAHDITAQRLAPPAGTVPGTVWQVSSVGYVFTRLRPFQPTPDPFTDPDPRHIKIESKSVVSTEFRQLNVTPPYTAAVIVNDLDNVKVNALASIQGVACSGSGYGAAAYANGTVGVSGSGSFVKGAPASVYSGGTSFNTYTVFGMNQSDLKPLADFYVNAVSQLYSPPSSPCTASAIKLSPEKLYYLGGASGAATNFVFTGMPCAANYYPMKGASDSILYVDGSLTITPQSTDFYSFTGIIYATGPVTINPPTQIDGVVISEKGVYLNTINGTDAVVLDYCPSIIQTTKQEVASYRESQSAIRYFSGLPPN